MRRSATVEYGRRGRNVGHGDGATRVVTDAFYLTGEVSEGADGIAKVVVSYEKTRIDVTIP